MRTESTLRVPADVKQLALIRRFVEEQALALSVAEPDVYDLVLAVNEIATNIVIHGYRGQPGEIEIEMRAVGSGVEICLRDQAPAFGAEQEVGGRRDRLVGEEALGERTQAILKFRRESPHPEDATEQTNPVIIVHPGRG